MCRVRWGRGAQGWGYAQGCWEGAADEGSLALLAISGATSTRFRICYIKSRVGTIRGVAPVALTQSPPTLPRRWTPSEGRHGRV